MLIPLVAFLTADALPTDLPGPVAGLAQNLAELEPNERILMLGGALIFMVVLRGMLQVANNAYIASLESKFAKSLTDRLAEHLLDIDYGFYLQHDRGRILHIFWANAWAVVDIFRAILTGLPSLVGLVVIVAILAWLDWRLTILALLCAGLLSAAIARIHSRQRIKSKTEIVLNQKLGARMRALVMGMRAIKLYRQEASEAGRFARASEQLRLASYEKARLAGYTVPVVATGVALTFCTILIASNWLAISIPVITAFLVLLARAEPHASQLVRSYSTMNSEAGASEEVAWLLRQEETSPYRGSKSVRDLDVSPISFAEVSFCYPDETLALENVSFELKPGEATALVGPSGSGKSTVVNLLCGMLAPTSGKILVGEIDLSELDIACWRKQFAIAGQDVPLVEGSIADNICFGHPNASRDEIQQAARAAGAEEFISRLRDGYDSRLSFMTSELSGGERQRIGLARALLRRPKFLILDEATNAVDPLTERAIMNVLKEHRFFDTAVIISHRLETLMLCENGVVLEAGVVRETGPMQELCYHSQMARSS